MALPRPWSERIVDGSRCGFARARSERRLARAGGRGRRSVRRSEVSRVDHVTVDNAVLDAPKRSFHAPWSALEKPKLDPRRQPRSTWYRAHPPVERLEGFLARGRSVSGHRSYDEPQGSPMAGATGQGWVARGCELARRVRLRTRHLRKEGASSEATPEERPMDASPRGATPGRPTRSRTSSGCSISRVGCRVRGDASLRIVGRARTSGPSRERWSTTDRGARLDGRRVAVLTGRRVAAK